MKIVYLILAHTDPPQLRRLVNSLNGHHAFIHIDKKVDVSQFVAETQQQRNLHFLEQRIRVSWGGFSIVRATLALMHAALDSGMDFDYFVLLSGLDYPIKNDQFILDYFARQQGRELIRYVNILDEPFLEWKIRRTYFNDHRLVCWTLRNMARFRALERLQSLVLKRPRFPRGLKPYFGSQWWALTKDCVRYILNFVNENKQFVDFYRYTDVPDEMFFHTIIMNSDYGEKTNQRVEYGSWFGSGRPVKEAGDRLKYVDWSANRERPSILDERDFECLAESPYLFARKFTSSRSLKLTKRIDKHLLHCDSS